MTGTPPQLGTIGVTPTFGNNFDRFVARGIQWATATRNDYTHKWTNAKVNHAVLYVGDGKLVQAQPGGAVLSPWDSYGDSMIWLGHKITGLDNAHRSLIAANGRALVGRGYGFADFLAIALAQQRLHGVVNPAHPPWWALRLGNTKRLICSQLCDYAYTLSGIHLFDDGRPPGLVSPADLYALGAVGPA